MGACPSRAIPYKVREAMYWSELAAEKVKIKMHALITEGRPLIPAEVTIENKKHELNILERLSFLSMTYWQRRREKHWLLRQFPAQRPGPMMSTPMM
jgi:hypothetical protein